LLVSTYPGAHVAHLAQSLKVGRTPPLSLIDVRRRNQKVVDTTTVIPPYPFFVIRSPVTISKAPMSSLKGYVPALARHLGISPAAYMSVSGHWSEAAQWI